MLSDRSCVVPQDIKVPRQIWISRWSDSKGLPRFKTFATQEEAIQHLAAVILRGNDCCYVQTLWACETVSGGINRGELDLRPLI